MKGSNTLVLFPMLGDLLLRPASLRGGTMGSGLVVLRRKVSGDATVALTSTGGEIVKVPAEITVSAGQNTASFSFATQHVIAQHPVTITASYEGATRKATLTVVP